MTFHSSLNPFYQVTIGPIYQLSRVGVLSYSILLSSHLSSVCVSSQYSLLLNQKTQLQELYMHSVSFNNIAILVFERI